MGGEEDAETREIEALPFDLDRRGCGDRDREGFFTALRTTALCGFKEWIAFRLAHWLRTPSVNGLTLPFSDRGETRGTDPALPNGARALDRFLISLETKHVSLLFPHR